MIAFADTSALVKLYADEPGHDIVRAHPPCGEQLCRVEVPVGVWSGASSGRVA